MAERHLSNCSASHGGKCSCGVGRGLTETEARALRDKKRAQSLADIRTKGEANGVSDRLITETENSLRGAFVVGDMFDQLFGGRGLG